MRDISCDDCVVTMLLGPLPGAVQEHTGALQVLADAGLVPPLRLVTDPVQQTAGSGSEVHPDTAVG